MANAIYPIYKQALLTAGANVDMENGDVRVILVNVTGAGTLYTYSAAHDFLDDVAAGSRVATSAALTGNTVANGLFDADNVTFSAVSGDTVEAIIIYIHDGGADSARRLVAYIDTGVTGLPVTPNGGDIQIQWNASGIFQL